MSATTYAVGDVVYRVEDRLVASGYQAEWGGWVSTPSAVYVGLRTYVVERLTPCGFWFSSGPVGATVRGERIWRNSKTKWVSATPADAMAEALRRRRYHIQKAEGRLDTARRRLAALERYATAFSLDADGREVTQ
ncbi:MAG: hypothetical protein GY772_20310 [bacterium]|nr:hypothetical protein [bacterium]